MGNLSSCCSLYVRSLIFSISIVCAFVSSAQDTLQQDSTYQEPADTLEEPKKPYKELHGGVYIEGVVESVPGLSKRNFSQQFGLGLKYEFLSVGIYQNRALGRIARTLIFPNDFELIYGYGGGYLGFEVVKIRWLSGGTRLNYGHGDIVWERIDNGEDLLRDTFHLLKPEIYVNVSPIKYFRAFIMAGYRRFMDVDIATLDDQSLSGFTFAVGIKMGYFK